MFDTLNLLWLKLLPSVLKILHITWSISKMATENQVQTKMLCSKPQHMLAHIDSPNNLKISDIFRESIWGKLLLKIPKIGPLILFLAERKTGGLILVTLALIGKGRKCIHFFFSRATHPLFQAEKRLFKAVLVPNLCEVGVKASSMLEDITPHTAFETCNQFPWNFLLLLLILLLVEVLILKA